MQNSDLKWIKDVIFKLQSPMTYNERKRLTDILVGVSPALIDALEHSALSGFSTYFTNDKGEDELVRAGHTCNACGQDHYFKENNPKHIDTGVKRDGTGGEQCRYEKLLQILEDAEKEKDK